MKKIIELVKAGASLVPAITIWAYFIFIGLDIFTTYLASPDLEFESNWLIRILDLSFQEIIICASVFGVFLSLIFFIANAVLKFERENNIKSNNLNKLLSNRKVFGCFLVISIFYSHFFISIFVSINNYLNYLYLRNWQDHLLYLFAFKYVNFESFFFPNFNIYTQTFFVVIAIIYSAFYLKKFNTRKPPFRFKS